MDNSQTIIIEDNALRAGFTSTPNWLLENPNLTSNAKILYLLLLSYAWQKGSCFPGQSKLMKAMAIKSPQTLKKHLEELKNAGMIDWKQRGLNKTNVYIVKKFELESQSTEKPESQYVENIKDSEEEDTEKETLTHSKTVKRIKDFKYHHITSIAQQYSVDEKFVTSKLEDLKLYCETHGKRYKNYYSALQNFVKKDSPQNKKVTKQMFA